MASAALFKINARPCSQDGPEIACYWLNMSMRERTIAAKVPAVGLWSALSHQ